MFNNDVSKIINLVSDDDLKKAIVEINDIGTSGILGNGVVRSTASNISSQLDIPIGICLTIAQNGLLSRAAFKWADITVGNY